MKRKNVFVDKKNESSYGHLCNPTKNIGKYEFRRVLREDSPQAEYRRRNGELKTAVHWGQRKLMVSEIEFLTKYGYDSSTCVYAGAAPGLHISYLSYLFPTVNFVLVDPKEITTETMHNVSTYNDFMTDTLARTFYGRNILFISDIRSADYTQLTQSEMDSEVTQDMSNQMKWHILMNPRASMLKFRLPWTSGKTKYLNGDIYFPVYGPQTTTESRLVVDNNIHKQVYKKEHNNSTIDDDRSSANVYIEYDHQKYWEQMFHFNSVIRSEYTFKWEKEHVQRNDTECNNSDNSNISNVDPSMNPSDSDSDLILHHSSVVSQVHGMDYCYDCTAERTILDMYCRKVIEKCSHMACACISTCDTKQGPTDIYLNEYKCNLGDYSKKYSTWAINGDGEEGGADNGKEVSKDDNTLSEESVYKNLIHHLFNTLQDFDCCKCKVAEIVRSSAGGGYSDVIARLSNQLTIECRGRESERDLLDWKQGRVSWRHDYDDT